MRFTSIFLGGLISLLFVFNVSAQLTVQTGQTPTQLVQNVLVGSGTNAFNITSQGLPLQFGKFNGVNSNIGLDSGVVLSTNLLTGPLVFDGPSSNSPFSPANSPGHPLLNQLVSPYQTFCAAVISFQFIPDGDTLQFDYVFASEEYHVYVNSSFNDAFGFFLSGPNPFGAPYNNTNIALIPGTTNPVTINSVNNGQTFNNCTPGTGPSNPQYFVDNCMGQTVCFNGFTVPLTAMAPVIPCSTYTITLAVANTSDQGLQSAVFLEANSFQTNQVLLSANNNTVNGSVDTALFEGCGTVDLVLHRTGDISDPFTAQLTISGTATNGVDYSLLPDSVVFQAGQDSVVLTIIPIWDLITEGTESITITVTNITCFNQSSSSITFLLYNTEPLTINAGNDTVMDCTGGTLTANIAGGVPPFTINWSTGATYTGPNTSLATQIMPTQDGWYVATVSDICGNTAIDSVFVDFLEEVFAGFSIDPPSPGANPIEGCGQAAIRINRTEFINFQKTYPIQITGTATNGTDYTFIPQTIMFNPGDLFVTVSVVPLYDMLPEGTETVIISIVDTTCNGSLLPFSQTVNIRNVDPIVVDAGPDLVANCPRIPQNIDATVSGGWPQLTYSWSNGASSEDIMNALPPTTTVYILTVTDSCGNTGSDEVEILIPVDPVADFNVPEGIFCAPQGVQMTDLSFLGSGATTWEWRVNNGTYVTGQSPVILFPQPGTFDITLLVSTQYSCKDSITKQITLYPTPTALPYFSPQNPTSLFPEVQFWEESLGNPILWEWWVDGTPYTGQSFSHYFNSSGIYEVILVVTTEYGCADTTILSLEVKDETSVYIPNAFTPDGNQLNNFWGPQGVNWEKMELRVFNRWGEEVFFSDKKDYLWNGKKYNAGSLLKQDVYVYKLDIVDIYGKEFSYHGQVNIIY